MPPRRIQPIAVEAPTPLSPPSALAAADGVSGPPPGAAGDAAKLAAQAGAGGAGRRVFVVLGGVDAGGTAPAGAVQADGKDGNVINWKKIGAKPSKCRRPTADDGGDAGGGEDPAAARVQAFASVIARIERQYCTGPATSSGESSEGVSDGERGGSGEDASGDDSDGPPSDADVDAAAPKPRRRQKFDAYDYEDAFLDDSELATVAAARHAKRKYDGFYINAGAVERANAPASTATAPRPGTAMTATSSEGGGGAADGGKKGKKGGGARASGDGGGDRDASPSGATPAFEPPASLAAAVDALRALAEAAPPPKEGARQIPASLRDPLARVACEADASIGTARNARHWLSATLMQFLGAYTTRGNLTARLRTEMERVAIDLRVADGKLRSMEPPSLPPGDHDAGTTTPSPAWPADVDRAIGAWVKAKLLVDGGTLDGPAGARACADAAAALRLPATAAAADAVRAAVSRAAAPPPPPPTSGRGKSPAAKSPPLPPPPDPVTEGIVAAAIAAGAAADTVTASLAAFPGGTNKAAINKALLTLGAGGGTVADVMAAANRARVTGDTPWDETAKGKKSHISTALGAEGGKFWVHTGAKRNSYVFAHAAFPGVVATTTTRARAGSATPTPAEATGAAGTAARAARRRAASAGERGGSADGGAAEVPAAAEQPPTDVASIATILLDPDASVAAKAAALASAPADVLATLRSADPGLAQMIEAVVGN